MCIHASEIRSCRHALIGQGMGAPLVRDGTSVCEAVHGTGCSWLRATARPRHGLFSSTAQLHPAELPYSVMLCLAGFNRIALGRDASPLHAAMQVCSW